MLRRLLERNATTNVPWLVPIPAKFLSSKREQSYTGHEDVRNSCLLPERMVSTDLHEDELNPENPFNGGTISERLVHSSPPGESKV